MRQVSKKHIKEIIQYEIEGSELIEILRKHGGLPSAGNAEFSGIYVKIPGGGDWSNTNLDLEDNPIIIQFVKETIS